MMNSITYHHIFTLILLFTTTYSSPTAVTHFQQYLQINTAHPTPNYTAAVTFLTHLANSIPNLTTQTLYLTTVNKPLLIVTLPGSNPELRSVLLNSHLDSVPAEPSKWAHPPFAAVKIDSGEIFARGAQDDKCIGVQYLEAIRNIFGKDPGFEPVRTVHICYVPDEEIEMASSLGASSTTVGPLVGTQAAQTVANHAEKPEKFSGLNFKRWQQKMLFYLTTLNLARFLTESPPTPPTTTEAGADVQFANALDAWRHSEYLCRNYVLNGLVDALYNVYCKTTTTKELWESLGRKYKTEDAGTKKFVVSKFLDFKMVDSKTVISQVQELQLILSDIHSEGMTHIMSRL